MAESKWKDTSAFLLGLAVGAIIGYFLHSEKVDEIVEEMKIKLNKWRTDIEDQLDKGASWLQEMASKEES
ncbi:MAG: YtxH domain-containing protein [Thermoflavifilum sp.]|jgi:uncharacterized membrane-anchored protein YhcB (DUF1043 family)|uniref:YtxH domain-containing protein n=1 Tax=Thermoflavifilum sp. TaxID=1968839 RepID=UPI0018A40C04|nr:YtxH domain-containing protein [Thermoflavifilum sp.]QOR76780.1 MAG: YtxH domain-containing protein [Thermoflavifilum sp.]